MTFDHCWCGRAAFTRALEFDPPEGHLDNVVIVGYSVGVIHVRPHLIPVEYVALRELPLVERSISWSMRWAGAHARLENGSAVERSCGFESWMLRQGR